MPYKITNITDKTTKSPVPLTISYSDTNITLKEIILPGQHIILYFIPKIVQQLHIRNMVTIEFISNNDVLPTKVNRDNNFISKSDKNSFSIEISDNEGIISRKGNSKQKKSS